MLLYVGKFSPSKSDNSGVSRRGGIGAGGGMAPRRSLWELFLTVDLADDLDECLDDCLDKWLDDVLDADLESPKLMEAS